MLDIAANYGLVRGIFHQRLRMARRRGGLVLRLDRDDAFQDFLLDLHRKQGTPSAYDPTRAGLGTYLILLADHSIVRSVRALSAGMRRMLVIGDEEDASLGDDLASDAPGPSDALADAEVHARLEHALSVMRERDRFCLEQHDGQGATLWAIAKVLGCTKARVHQLVRRGRARLAKRLVSREG